MSTTSIDQAAPRRRPERQARPLQRRPLRARRRLLYCVGLALVLASIAHGTARADWRALGANPPPGTACADAVSIDGTLYMAVTEPVGTNYRLRVLRFSAPDDTWQQIGGDLNHAPDQAGPPGNPLLNITFCRIAAVGGVPWVAWAEYDGTDFAVRAARLSGSSWVEAGSAPVGRGHRSGTFDVEGLDITGIVGAPYVAWSEYDVGSAGHASGFEVRVSRFNGASWQELVGGPDPVNETDSAAAPDNGDPNVSAVSLTNVDDVPWVAWAEWDGVNDEVRVAKLSASGTAFVPVGPAASPVNQSATQPRPFADQPRASARIGCLTTIGGDPYVSWSEFDGTAYQGRVSRLNAAGTQWVQVVGGPSPLDVDPAQPPTTTGDNILPPCVVGVGGRPVVAWSERRSGVYQAFVDRLSSDGTTWAGVDGPLVQSGEDALVERTLDVGGVPFVAVRQLQSGEVGMLRLAPDVIGISAAPDAQHADLLAELRTFGFPYRIGFDYGTDFASRTLTTATTGDEDTVELPIGGLAPGTTVPFRPFALAGLSAPSLDYPGSQFTTNGPSIGPPGPAGATTRVDRLLVALVDPVPAAPGQRVKLRFVTTAPGAASLSIGRGRQRLAHLVTKVVAGRDAVTWNGRVGRKPPPPGRYTVTLTVTSSDGQTATDATTLTLRRRHRRP